MATDSARARALSIGALVVAAASVLLPWIALPAIVLVLVASLSGAEKYRRFVAIGGGLLAFAGFGRFVVEVAAPNIVAAGQRSAEEKAVSRLREILWAEDRAKELALVDSDHDGVGEYATLGELLGTETGRVTKPLPDALLKSGLYTAVPGTPGVYRVEAYLVRVVPGPDAGADAAERGWVAYAWPAETSHGGRRVFFIDEDERICETSGAGAYSGAGNIPDAWSAFGARRADAERCGTGTDGRDWRPWKKKKARTEARDRG